MSVVAFKAKPLSIAGREIGPHQPPYLIAELSCNHSGSLDRAYALIDAAKEAGADAVKLQTYTSSELTSQAYPDLWSLYDRAKTPREWHAGLFLYARTIGITLFSSAFSVSGVAFLESLGTPAHKIASMEIMDEALIRAAQATGKPVLISTGMATQARLERVIDPNTMLLHCVSQYPARIEDANLNAIGSLHRLRTLVGLSDHTPGHETAIAATALGACVIEKHFKIDEDCLDAPYSLDPTQFKAMASAVRAIWQGMGTGNIQPTCSPRQR